MRRIALTLAAAAVITLAACGSDDDQAAEPATTAEAGAATEGGFSLVSPTEAAAIIADPPDDLVVLDVRTPEEYEEVRIEGAVLLDFNSPDFGEGLSELDRDVPYVVYCRSDNRSGQAVEQMRDQGFTNVTDVDGGIVAWIDAGLPTVAG